MDSEQIRNEVLTRLEIERAVRQQLDQDREREAGPPKRGWPWLESKLGLLLVGSVITGVLIPTFQFTQERLKWHRQNRYDNIEQRLEGIHESLEQFIAVQSVSAELYDLGLDVIESRAASLPQARLEKWREEFLAIRKRRLQQNSKFAATVFFFPGDSRDSIREAWNDLLRPSQDLQILVGGLLGEGARSSDGKALAQPLRETALQLDSRIADVNLAYEQVLTMLRQQLKEVEDEGARFQ